MKKLRRKYKININKFGNLQLDFQNCFVGSLGYDINYFLYTSLELNVLKLHYYDLLHSYYVSFEQTLRQCKAEYIPKYNELCEEITAMQFVGLYAALCEYPICCMSLENAEGFTDQSFGTTKHEALYRNAQVVEMIRYGLDRFEELHVLD